MQLLKTFLTVMILSALIWLVCPEPEIRHPQGARIASEPRQVQLSPQKLPAVQGYELTAIASYELTARVLSTKHYWADHQKLVPYDVALGWGPMSDQAVLDQLQISQGNRFFFYSWSSRPPIPQEEIICHASNHHVISANREIAKVISKLQRGQCVWLRGKLVNVRGPDGFQWNTSTVRTDSGNGACEVFYVEEINILDAFPSAAITMAAHQQ